MKKIIAYWQTILCFGIMLIGDQYFRLHLVPQPDGTKKPKLDKVSRAQVHDDYPKASLRLKIKRFSGFVMFPQNVDYQQFVDGYYNLYDPPSIVPESGCWDTIRKFLFHLFGPHLNVMLDYLYLLYLRPQQRLPVLVLISKERRTGKTTFLKLLSAWFGGNMAVATNMSLRSQFNSDWAGKLILGIDEALLQRRQDSEMIKAMATADTMLLEAKGRDRIAVPNYTHIILCSNNLNDPVLIDPEEDRYMVFEVPPIREEDEGLLAKMKAELPAFAWYLEREHQMSFPMPQSRLWFPPSSYATEALNRIKRASGDPECQMIAEVLTNIMDELGIDEISMTISDIQKVLQDRGFRYLRLSKILRAWPGKLMHAADNLTYYTFVQDGKLVKEPVKTTGRYYTFIYHDLVKLIPNG